ncbi:hypothetical protein [Rhodococcus sp. X156]|uniref:hypothetical protein n=1 Tax=Rhodococcus sp. X156 TaxID=2499145 RepID=UPI0019D12978|nr:hypothetical protein [Rhodococcus sp. X156]
MSVTGPDPGRDEDCPLDPPLPPGRFADDLVGLDPDDPDAQAFAAHLDRIERSRPSFTVEGYLAGVGDFATSANRAGGLRRLVAVTVVALVLLGVLYAVWNALVAISGML